MVDVSTYAMGIGVGCFFVFFFFWVVGLADVISYGIEFRRMDHGRYCRMGGVEVWFGRGAFELDGQTGSHVRWEKMGIGD